MGAGVTWRKEKTKIQRQDTILKNRFFLGAPKTSVSSEKIHFFRCIETPEKFWETGNGILFKMTASRDFPPHPLPLFLFSASHLGKHFSFFFFSFSLPRFTPLKRRFFMTSRRRKRSDAIKYPAGREAVKFDTIFSKDLPQAVSRRAKDFRLSLPVVGSYILRATLTYKLFI